MPAATSSFLVYSWRCCRCTARVQAPCDEPGQQEIFYGFICCLKCNHTLCRRCAFMSVEKHEKGAEVKKEEEDDDESCKVKKEGKDDVKVKVEAKQEK
ncbi:hypothetical protein L13192_04704 [Pyrenophora tritici-repentis]|uniref:Uncharacterized protein n=1 Tax=Pyrenophora tritici-repentis TaxID=45151 RepID=A0A2W1ES19_9PLEO|nr:hypothetical protein Ptr86124_004973 [Pyrenophora tritici-repentis]KAI1671347.1 hypothetical protein L13192_04704 [Pyrenophora tritici-repentis]KAI1685162.1 hypothetical protein KJE20_05446 [Pyrenophora tritici-repentis]PWO24835.1 leupeptin-inactivating enzyme 1 precursor [Pyrenophora tritici-repentis]